MKKMRKAAERPTDQQIKCIKHIEETLGVIFTGTTFTDAWVFINENYALSTESSESK